MTSIPEIKPEQSLELLKELHILTRDGKLNQDSRRKLKQVYHLYQFIEPLLQDLLTQQDTFALADHGAGKSYLGFILYDLFLKSRDVGHVYGIETREDLVKKSQDLAKRLSFARMSFLNLSVETSIRTPELPPKIDIVTALHACDTATDDAIKFAFAKQARHIVLVPCCQAEVAGVLRQHRASRSAKPRSPKSGVTPFIHANLVARSPMYCAVYYWNRTAIKSPSLSSSAGNTP